MINANTVINDALTLIGYTAFGEAPEAEASQLGARLLQGMLADWSIHENINPNIRVANVASPYNAGNGQYLTVGSADPTNDIPFDIMDIVNVQVSNGNLVFKLVQISYEEYMLLSMKNVGSIPQYYAFDYQEPQGKIYFHLANLSGYTAQVIYRPRLTQVVNNQTILNLDMSWQQALTYNLATRLYPALPGLSGLDPQIIWVADNSLKHIKNRNTKMNMKKARPAFSSGGRGYGGYWMSPLNTIGSN